MNELQHQHHSNTAINDRPQWLSQFIAVYNQLNKHSLDRLNELYHPNIVFIDPLHHVNGIEPLKAYFAKSYKNIELCHFDVYHTLVQSDHAAIYWKMTMVHRKLNGANEIIVDGHSQLQVCDGKVIFHRDFLDLGEMLYEQIPLIGPIIQWIKRKASN